MSRIQNIRWFDLHFCNLFIFKKENLQFDKKKKEKKEQCIYKYKIFVGLTYFPVTFSSIRKKKKYDCKTSSLFS